ncbi:hypothetical protein DVK05_00165 [Halorubrum sp. Atlit-8R]|uniref:hypothetical protein n=1 Tax=unclassified Halorubrum TaxID=2642239 RepID=UPI000EF271AA|nr:MULTISPECIES: hypothetical protein [unclassified Halorubrum]RLM71593.1 hypothetical protein DVK08_05600 [Halorubrum sp. Atlit-9R]RLM82252.1 hypothetical protein DVK05_00165 [Halorubrum sp. Atlit-8R]
MRGSLLPRLAVALLVLSSTGVVAVSADDPAIQLSSVTVTPDDPTTGEQVTIDATISNLENSDTIVDVTSLYVRSIGTTEEFARIENVGSISPGGSLSVPISATFETAGQKQLDVNLVVQDTNGDYHSYTYPVYVEVSESVVRADLSATATENESETVEVALTNFGNTNLTDVEITAAAGGDVFERNFARDVSPESSQVTSFDTSGVVSDTVEFTATYDAAGASHSTSLVTDINEETQVPGEIRLTAVEVSRTGSGVMIEGDAANLGGTDADSVLVQVNETADVHPVSPSGEYFVGGVEASEFATFELTAQTESNASVVPVTITYIVDNERVTTTQQVDLTATAMAVSPSATPGDSAATSSGAATSHSGAGEQGGLPLPLLAGGVVLITILLAGVAYRWRSQ